MIKKLKYDTYDANIYSKHSKQSNVKQLCGFTCCNNKNTFILVKRISIRGIPTISKRKSKT